MKELISADVTVLTNELADRTEKLAALYLDLAFHRSEELWAKSQAWESYPNESQSFRDKVAQYAATSNTRMAIQTEAQIKALTEEKYFILFLLNHANS